MMQDIKSASHIYQRKYLYLIYDLIKNNSILIFLICCFTEKKKVAASKFNASTDLAFFQVICL